MSQQSPLGVAICTFKRPHLLEKLIDDILLQELLPETLIVVDGNPESQEVKKLLRKKFSGQRPIRNIIYVPSNHANLSYQRYLAWKAAATQNRSYLLYLDDDVRLRSPEVTAKLVQAFRDLPEAVGITSLIRFGSEGMVKVNETWQEQRAFAPKRSGKKSVFKYSKSVKPGSLTPSGHRVPPESTGLEYSRVEWLRGGVMLYAMPALDEGCFSEDLFALNETVSALGEDTYLSRRISLHGGLFIANKVEVEHPDEDLPRAYPVKSYQYGVATAYSRRFLNDHYRISRPPYLKDRLALLKSYLGNILLNFAKFLRKPNQQRWEYFIGYFRGSVMGIFQKPLARSLTPGICWSSEVKKVLDKIESIESEKI